MPIAKRRLLDQTDLSDHEKKNLQILDTIRKKGPIARAEISRLIGLNIVTVTSYVDQYIKKDVIKEVGIDVSTGGRKPTLVDLNPFAMYAIGIGLSLTKMIIVLTNFKGEVMHRIEKERTLRPGEELVQMMISLTKELIEKSNVNMSKVYGIGIGMPGPLDRDSNSVRWEAGLVDQDLHINFSINALFDREFDVPTYLDNDANTAMFGENWYGSKLGLKNAVYFYSGDGCGILINGEVYRGTNGAAGEWLFNTPDDHLTEDLLPFAKNRPWWSLDLGVSLRAEAYQSKNPNSKIYSLVDGDARKVTLKTVVKASESGDAFAQELLRGAGERLGRKAAIVVNMLNPEVLIIGGGVEIGGAFLLDAVRETMKGLASPEAMQKLRIVPSQLGENAVPLGAAALVAQNYFVNV